LNHFTTPDFWVFFDALPNAVQRLASANFDRLKANPRHPSLRLKKVGPYWSARVGRNYRALGKDVDGGILWGWIGPHAEYDTILRG
jgi:hypothetical protein